LTRRNIFHLARGRATSNHFGVESDSLTGARLGAARRQANLTQRELASELGVTVRTLQNYEAGRFVPYRHMHRITSLLGCTVDWLLHGEPDTPDVVDVPIQ